EFKPVAGAALEGEIQDANGRTTKLSFTPRAAGSYEAVVDDPPPGRYRISARASRAGTELGRATSEFAVDRWSLEEARAEPDSATLAAIAAASGGGGLDAGAIAGARAQRVASPLGIAVGVRAAHRSARHRVGLAPAPRIAL